MDKRDFVLGLGIGIIFSVIVIWIVYAVSDMGSSELTNEEIEQKARELGMEYVSDEVFLEMTEDLTETESSSSYPDKYEPETAEMFTYNNIETEGFSVSNEDMTEILDNETETIDFTLNSTEKLTENTSEIITENTSDEGINFIDVKINSGSNAKKVSRILADKGLVDDPNEYEKYLINNKKTKNIRTGNYKIPQGVDFDTLTDILTRVPSN